MSANVLTSDETDRLVSVGYLYCSEKAAFLAAIAVNPTDFTPRLVYADWLEEHDRPTQASDTRALVEVDKVYAKIEERPEEYHLRQKLADALAVVHDEEYSRLAYGYRCLAEQKLAAWHYPDRSNAAFCWTHVNNHNRSSAPRSMLPKPVFDTLMPKEDDRVFWWVASTRRKAEDAAARAFAEVEVKR
jgi:uncharacterized protein (TIGR02996 family)